ncbi:MAG: stage II sporulation protein P [Clostridia bacterium]|nr:stage II sporulation protein P [Clostridia bacterium]
MHRKTSHRTTILLFLFLLVWVPVCLWTGILFAVRELRSEPAKAIAEVPTPEPKPAKTFEPYALSAAYTAFETGLSLRGEQPKILIYHTHTTEAYFPTESSPYRQTSRWRTADSERSVVAVGERLKTILERDYGFSVIHDTTDHEPPKLATAYERSEQTMRAYREQYPSIEVFIDLHRDAYGSEPKEPTDFVTVNGEQLARLMFVVGHGEAYEDKPFYETNRRFAERITDYLADVDPNLVRPIREKTGRYNQHIGAYCLLVEVGHNANTLEQALASVPYLAEGIAYAAAETEHTVTSWLPQAEN